MTNKPVKLPEAGQWPDKVAPWALLAGIVLSTLGFLMAFLYAGPVNGAAVDGVELIGGQMVANKLLLSQKIFYFHMPVALVSFCALAFACYYSVRFLATKNQRFDTCAKVCMEISLVFVICTMITGDLWERFEWGVWWTWEPRLTTYLILMLIVIAYFVLRNAIDEPERRGVYRHHRHGGRAHLLHGHASYPLGRASRGAARGRHVRRYGHDRGRVLGGPYARWVRAVPFPLPPGSPAGASAGPQRRGGGFGGAALGESRASPVTR